MAPTVLPGLAQQIYPTVDPQQAAAPAPQQQPTGILDSFFGGGSMTPNQQMMLSLGAGMLANSRKRPGEAFGAAVPQAMQQQAIAQKLFSEDEEKKRKERARQQLGAWYSNPQVMDSLNLSDELKPYFQNLAQQAPETIPDLLKGLDRKPGALSVLTEQQMKDANIQPREINGKMAYPTVYNDGSKWHIDWEKGPLVSNTFAPGGQKLSPGMEALDVEYAKKTVEPWISGGRIETAGQIAVLDSAMRDFEKNPELISGPGIGVVQAIGGDTVSAVFNPASKNVQEKIASVVQRSLRETLGGQFAMLEGTQLIQRAFNPSLPPEMNKQRLAILKAKLEETFAAKDNLINGFVKQGGTLQGVNWLEQKGAADFIELDKQWAAEEERLGAQIDVKPAPNASPQDTEGAFIKYLREQFGITR